jgi:EAL domain-containing protein (putative c-di-GMP-specific phosphodiesterase class I)
MLIDSIDETAARMHEIKKRGVQFSLDDFGTGYSSLSYLKRLPFDQLKIDRAFVHDLLDDLGSRAIAQAIISLGHALGLNVVAEGVESCDQRDLLLLGCSTFQGHFFGRPQPLEEFERRWRNPEHPQETRTALLRRS